jgi:multidrug resistance protein
MMLAPSVPQVLETFRPDGSDRALGSFCVTVYILGFCVGPLLLGPLSDVYGRATLLRFCIVFFTVLTVACAVASSLEMLIAFRFLAGMFGGAPMAIGGAVIADMYPSGARGRPMAWYSAGTMLGPTLGPVLGGLIDGTLGWRWVFRIASILVKSI